MALSLFETFLITHFIMDWIFQTEWEATQKSKKWFPLVVHCFVYTIGFIPAFFFYKISLSWLLLIFISHIILDQRKFEILLIEKLKKFKKEKMSKSMWWIILIGIDQILHLTVLTLIVVFA